MKYTRPERIQILTYSSSILCEHSDSEGKVSMIFKCFQGDDSIAVHSFLHGIVGWVEPYWNTGCKHRTTEYTCIIREDCNRFLTELCAEF